MKIYSIKKIFLSENNSFGLRRFGEEQEDFVVPGLQYFVRPFLCEDRQDTQATPHSERATLQKAFVVHKEEYVFVLRINPTFSDEEKFPHVLGESRRRECLLIL
jgi:hypothetical protein